MLFTRVGSLRRFQPLFLVQYARLTTASHASRDPKRISIPSRGSGSLTVDIYYPKEHQPKPRIVLYIPAAIPLNESNAKSEATHGSGRIASLICNAADATVVKVNYRLGNVQGPGQVSSLSGNDTNSKVDGGQTVYHAHPTPLHDVVAALDWVNSDLVLAQLSGAPGKATRIAVYGELNGGSMALALAMTECRKEESVLVGAVATRDAVVDWVSISNQPSQNLLSNMKRQIFHPEATHPGSPFDPFISPIHFLRTPLRQVPLTAAQKAAKEAEDLGEAFKDIATLDDVLAQEAWVADDSSSALIDSEHYREAQTQETAKSLAEDFATLQMADDENMSVPLDLAEKDHQRNTDMLDGRVVDEEYVSATTRMAIADTEHDQEARNIAQADSKVAQKQNGIRSRPRRDDKGQLIASRSSLDKAMMRHRKWPAIPGYFEIPHFNSWVSLDKASKYGLNSLEATTVAAQNQEMVKLLQRALIRENVAGIKDHSLKDEDSQPYARSQSRAEKTQREANLGEQEMEVLLHNAQKQVCVTFVEEDNTVEAQQREDDYVYSLAYWFERVLWTNEQEK